MWSPNELLKIEKQRDILSYITLQFFHFKKVPLEHCPYTDTFSFFMHILKYERRGDLVSLDFISSKDVLKYMDGGRAVLIDLRTGEEYKRGHIPGAVSMPYETFDDKAPVLKKYAIIILCCDRGAASLLMGRKLSAEGYRILSIGGGMSAWRGPLVTK